MVTIETGVRPSVHDQVLVEADVDGRRIAIRAVVVNVLPDCLWLGLVRPNPQLGRILGGTQVSLTFPRGRAGMVASEPFLSLMGNTQSRVFAVGWHDHVEFVQRRSYLRLHAECPIEYTVLQGESIESGTTGIGITRDVSASGVRFRIDGPIERAPAVDDLLEVRLSLGSGVVMAEAVVVRVEDATDTGPDGRPLPPIKATHKPVTTIAVQFESITEAAQDRIVRYIFYQQRIQRRQRDLELARADQLAARA